jgi:hypothetical protein
MADMGELNTFSGDQSPTEHGDIKFVKSFMQVLSRDKEREFIKQGYMRNI